ncbi:MAG: hypothetical protein LBF93_07575 [Zoogloeaceae bacterium]|jgi:hypothetical protein|nr:hypothetical protein [Zoogloeaceae bacterium]
MSGDVGSSKKSSSQTNTTSTNTDKRIVADANATVLSTDNASGAVVNITQDATNGEGFGRLLDLAEGIFIGGGEMVREISDSAQAGLQSVNTAANDREGQIDQKTIVILAAAGVAALYFGRKR